MLEVMKCLVVENGFICLIDGDYDKSIEDLKDEDITISFMKGRIAIILQEKVIIPIPEATLDYFVDNANLTLYPFNPLNYIEKPIVTISLSRDTMVETRSIYHYSKAPEGEQ
ncbi:MAG: hypothetical protein WCQ90_15820 [Deltaproteobacteria bacterium]